MSKIASTPAPLKLTLGAQVRQILPAPIVGVVDEVRVDEQALKDDPLNPKPMLHVVWEEGTDEFGKPQAHGRWFHVAEVDVIANAPPQADA